MLAEAIDPRRLRPPAQPPWRALGLERRAVTRRYVIPTFKPHLPRMDVAHRLVDQKTIESGGQANTTDISVTTRV